MFPCQNRISHKYIIKYAGCIDLKRQNVLKLHTMFKFISILMLIINITAFVPCSVYHDHECDDEHDFAQSGSEHSHCGGMMNNHCSCFKIITPSADKISPPHYSGKFNFNNDLSLIINLLDKSFFHPPRLS